MLRKLALQIIPPTIASLSKLSLVSEKIIYATVSKHLQNIISSHFLVFRRSRSWTIPQLFFDKSSGWIHCIEKAYAIYSDISTAYDQGDHYILFQNIQRLGLGVSLQKMVASSLRNRVQQVKKKSYLSDELSITRGVPQVSMLGKIFFLAFINDVPEYRNCHSCVFADDLKLASFSPFDLKND